MIMKINKINKINKIKKLFYFLIDNISEWDISTDLEMPVTAYLIRVGIRKNAGSEKPRSQHFIRTVRHTAYGLLIKAIDTNHRQRRLHPY